MCNQILQAMQILMVNECMCLYTGAFGVVHKGELRSSDGNMKAVAIKSIKCMSVMLAIIYI